MLLCVCHRKGEGCCTVGWFVGWVVVCLNAFVSDRCERLHCSDRLAIAATHVVFVKVGFCRVHRV